MYRLRKVGKKERKFCGVCGGISKYVDPELDPVVIRILWTIITIFAPIPMLLLYFILAMVLKREDYVFNVTEKEKTE